MFWSNFFIPEIDIKSPPNFINGKGKDYIEKLKTWLGIDYDKNIYYEGNNEPAQVLRNCVHPKIGLHILERAQRSKSNKRTKADNLQLNLFNK